MLTSKDVCIVIATYNRAADIKKTLSSLIKYRNIPGKIVVVDQSKDLYTKEVVEAYKLRLPLEYIYNKQPSSSIAKNRGIRIGKKTHKLLLILDDDVDLLPNFIKSALKEFNSDKKIKALGGVDLTQKIHRSSKGLSSLYFKLFSLPHQEKNKYRVIGPYGNTASPKVTKVIRDAQWLPGFNMFFRSEVFNEYAMPESKGYNVLEDIDSSYYLFKKYGKGSLVITPQCRAIHNFSQTARYAEKKRIYVNHEDHFYFYYAYFDKWNAVHKLIWPIAGIILGNLLRLLCKPTKNNFLSTKYNLSGIIYCFNHRKYIKKGILRQFLNDDLTFKE